MDALNFYPYVPNLFTLVDPLRLMELSRGMSLDVFSSLMKEGKGGKRYMEGE